MILTRLKSVNEKVSVKMAWLNSSDSSIFSFLRVDKL